MAHPDEISPPTSRKKCVSAAKQKIPQDTRAVSPVVGVMLMLIVTIIIAAVVSAYSGGFMGTSRPAPTAIFDVHIYAQEGLTLSSQPGNYGPDITITEISGDALPTKNLKITTTFTNNAGTMFAGNLSGEASVPCDAEQGDFSGVLVLPGSDQVSSVISSSTGGNPHWFGDPSAVLTPGESLTTAVQVCGSGNSPVDNRGLDALLGANNIADLENSGFGQGSVVEVRIIYTPGGNILFDKFINVE
jgi:FlaG/FlaF family flagellin (archaellin)